MTDICGHPHPIHGDKRTCSLEPHGDDVEHNNAIPEGTTALFEVAITATGEVRDAAGHLISSTPLSSTMVLTEDEVANLKE